MYVVHINLIGERRWLSYRNDNLNLKTTAPYSGAVVAFVTTDGGDVCGSSRA